MKTRLLRMSCISVVVLATATAVLGQKPRRSDLLGGPLAGPLVLGAPFSADAEMMATLTIAGIPLRVASSARYYRDSAGRSRVEQLSSRVTPMSTKSERHISTIIDEDPSDRLIETIDPVTRTVRSLPRNVLGLGLGGDGDAFTVPIGGTRFLLFRRADAVQRTQGLGEHLIRREVLGKEQVNGIEAVGTRMTLTLHTVRDAQPATIVDEQWEAPGFGVLVRARHSDSRYGTIDYMLTRVQRTEPSRALFVVPAEYVEDSELSRHDPLLTLVPPDLYEGHSAAIRSGIGGR